MSIRFPAEWEPQDAVLICWPHEQTKWAPYLNEAEAVFMDIAEAITRFENLIVVACDKACVRAKLAARGIPMNRVNLYEIESNDVWARDFGPITIYEDGKPVLLDFVFNGWGKKHKSGLDNQITTKLYTVGAFGNTPLRAVDLVLEGGSIDSDGAGTLLTTAECLLNPNRNPQFDKKQIEAQLVSELAVKNFQWLKNGGLAGDDTDSHVDTLARFCPDNRILYVKCDDPADEHFPALRNMEDELKKMNAFQLLPLPWPRAKFDVDGKRLPATYANFLIINGAVLVPTYKDPADSKALETVAKAFPDREIIGINCSTLILQHGSLHCVTMQIPKGVL